MLSVHRRHVLIVSGSSEMSKSSKNSNAECLSLVFKCFIWCFLLMNEYLSFFVVIVENDVFSEFVNETYCSLKSNSKI